MNSVLNPEFLIVFMEARFENIMVLATPHLKKGRRSGEYEHTLLVTNFMEKIVKAENLDASILIPAAILHDIGWSQVPKDMQINFRTKEARLSHMKEGAKLARVLLNKANYDAKKIDKICALVSVHDNPSRAIRIALTTANQKTLRDADVLYRSTKEAFWVDVKRFKEDSLKRLNKVKKDLAGLYTETAKKLAKTLIEEREKEVKKWRS